MMEEDFLKDAIVEFQRYRKLTDRALAQVQAEDFFRKLDGESNSVAQIVKHLAGNLRSRWTDFLTTDGEKPDRHRDTEFEVEQDSEAALRQRLNGGWGCLFETLEKLRPEDLSKKVTIRGEPHTVLQAIHRNITHHAYHVGQIVFLAKHFAGSRWETLSIPRGKSEQFNQAMHEKGPAK